MFEIGQKYQVAVRMGEKGRYFTGFLLMATETLIMLDAGGTEYVLPIANIAFARKLQDA